MDQRSSTGPFQPPPSWVTLCFGVPPKAPELSPDARCCKGCWDKAPSQTPPRGFFTKQPLPTPEQPMADTVTREKRSFSCGHQVGGPRSHSASASGDQSAPATTESESSAKSTKAGRGRLWLPLLGGTPLTRNSFGPSRESSMGSPWAAAMEFLPKQPCAAPSLARDLD